jgi:flagellar biosynthesis protein FlhA
MLVDAVQRAQPVVVEELTPSQLSLGEVQRVLQALLAEQVPIRDLTRIFEAVSLRSRSTKEVDALVEAARTVLGPAIVAQYVDNGSVAVISFEARLEQRLLESLRVGDGGPMLALDPDLAGSILSQVGQLLETAEQTGSTACLVCAPQIRAAVRRMTVQAVPRLAVLSYNELGGNVSITSAGVVSAEPVAIGA